MKTYRNQGTCSSSVSFDLRGGKVHNTVFVGGCNGNLKAMGILIEGKDAREVIALLKGTTCGHKPTSCADQLALALEKALAGK
ncbi:MAG: TIGR03905 family TSCPD domain-containing protein [Spirochaetaceae bacterium]|jgi:uncharacterized protein (TIGR03905 family)|nr:TIGR03905 family TSCPD domain-containing protein [Spirochaetaceae bacterium]